MWSSNTLISATLQLHSLPGHCTHALLVKHPLNRLRCYLQCKPASVNLQARIWTFLEFLQKPVGNDVKGCAQYQSKKWLFSEVNRIRLNSLKRFARSLVKYQLGLVLRHFVDGTAECDRQICGPQHLAYFVHLDHVSVAVWCRQRLQAKVLIGI